MPLTSARRLYPLAMLVGVLVALLLPTALPHPDSSYLRARYTQNLLDGHGLVYNAEERVLLTSAPLLVIAHALSAAPVGDIASPPVLLSWMGVAIGAAALIRILMVGKTSLWLIFGALLLWILAPLMTFGGVAGWLAVLGLLSVDAANHQFWGWATFGAALMLLLSPLALVFVILLGITLPEARRYWQLVFLPGVVWWGFALIYYGENGIYGLTLNTASVQDQPWLLMAGVIAGGMLLARQSVLKAHVALAIFGTIYTALALLFALTPDVSLLVVALALASLGWQYTWQHGLTWAGVVSIAFVVVTYQQPTCDPLPRAIDAQALGYVGCHQAVWGHPSPVYHLDGSTDPTINQLIEVDDLAGVLVATAPDWIWGVDVPTEQPAMRALRYTEVDSLLWQRQTSSGAWLPTQSRDLMFSPDIRLVGAAADRSAVTADGVLRLRLDWALVTGKKPQNDIVFQFNLLGFEQSNIGSIEQRFTPEQWQTDTLSTYHAIPINADAPLGRYEVVLLLGINAGRLATHPVIQVKVPAPTMPIDESSYVAQFGDGTQAVGLQSVDLTQRENDLTVDLVWQVIADFAQDYVIFVHLTPPDDIQPVLQADAPPLRGQYPTTIWQAGEVITDQYQLNDIPPGTYALRIGFFNPTSGRLTTAEGDSLLVGTVTIN